MINATIEEFLSESNKIEREYSKEALEDAKKAWTCGEIELSNKKGDIIKDVTPDLILAIHRRLMRRLNPRIAGKIRTCDVWVGNRKCLNPKEIKEELRLWCCHSLNPTYLGKEWIRNAHIDFEKIHPFEDGNGRTGRILMNLQRLKIGLPILVIHEGDEQYEYYKWFKQQNENN